MCPTPCKGWGTATVRRAFRDGNEGCTAPPCGCQVFSCGLLPRSENRSKSRSAWRTWGAAMRRARSATRRTPPSRRRARAAPAPTTAASCSRSTLTRCSGSTTGPSWSRSPRRRRARAGRGLHVDDGPELVEVDAGELVDDGPELVEVDAGELVDDGPELLPIWTTAASCSGSTAGPQTFRSQELYPWDRLRAVACARRPILAPAIDRVSGWPLPPGVRPSPELVIACALLYLTHAPIRELRSATWRRCHA